jgi:hypothetical protein
MATIFLIISALIFGCGILFNLIVFNPKFLGKIRFKTLLIINGISVGIVVLILAILATAKQIKFWQFLFFILVIVGVFSYLLWRYYNAPIKVKKGVNLSCGQEWLNLSYLLTLADRIKRFSLSEKESDFVENFTQKIRRMTSFYSYELPSGVEISEFYFICNRIGLV